MALHTGFRLRVRPRLGRGHPVRAPRQLAVPPGSALCADPQEVHGGLQRGQEPRRRRRHDAQRAYRRADRDRPLLGRELPAAVEPDRENRLRRHQAGSVAAGATCSACSTSRLPHGYLGCLRDQVRLRLLASGHRDIQTADTDGNTDTAVDPNWTPLVPTPPIPDYDSAHSVEGGAAARVLKRFFGTDQIGFETCSLTLPAGSTCDDARPVRRRYAGFSQAAAENGVSRILVGFHFRKAVDEGIEHGAQDRRPRGQRFLATHPLTRPSPCTARPGSAGLARASTPPKPRVQAFALLGALVDALEAAPAKAAARPSGQSTDGIPPCCSVPAEHRPESRLVSRSASRPRAKEATMKSRIMPRMSRLSRALLLAVVALVLAAPSAAAAPNRDPGGVLGDLWETVLETPTAENPFAGGDPCVDLGSVVAPAVAVLHLDQCTVKPSERLFISACSSECSTFEAPPYFGRDEAELRACARDVDAGLAHTHGHRRRDARAGERGRDGPAAHQPAKRQHFRSVGRKGIVRRPRLGFVLGPIEPGHARDRHPPRRTTWAIPSTSPTRPRSTSPSGNR